MSLQPVCPITHVKQLTHIQLHEANHHHRFSNNRLPQITRLLLTTHNNGQAILTQTIGVHTV